MTNRIFAAVFPPPQIIDRLEDHVAPRRESDRRLRWVFPEQWHLTTLFIDNCPERSVEPLLERLAETTARCAPFTVRLRSAGCFPDPCAVRVLYLGVGEGSQELADLSRNGRAAASTVGAHPDGSGFVPHLTLARGRSRFNGTQWLRVIDSFTTFDDTAFRFTAKELVVVHSHLRQGAAGRSRYEVLARLPLLTDGTVAGDPEPAVHALRCDRSPSVG